MSGTYRATIEVDVEVCYELVEACGNGRDEPRSEAHVEIEQISLSTPFSVIQKMNGLGVLIGLPDEDIEALEASIEASLAAAYESASQRNPNRTEDNRDEWEDAERGN